MTKILVYELEKKATRQGTPDELPSLLSRDDVRIWVDLEKPSEEEAQILSTVFKFHHLAVEDCIGNLNHPKIDDYGEYLYLVIHGVDFYAPKDRFDTQELDIFLGKNYLVTFHYKFSRSVSSNFDKCCENAFFMQKDCEFILYRILDTLADDYMPTLEALDNKIDDIEKKLFENPTQDILNKIFTLKKDILFLKRIVEPQREVLRKVAAGEFPQICGECSLLFRDIQDHLFMIYQLTDSYRDAVTGMLEAYLSITSNKLNEVMKVLTVIATIMMPLTLITGVYGMNFEYIPGLKVRVGFFVLVGLMVALSAFMLVLFRRKRWL